ncbi:hypothetical protein FOCC_FOCC003510 [Frankliniella occidentalis]|nr:hypothetical protein FOCC_FOCC003510 [Frankliniella occidentalis]
MLATCVAQPSQPAAELSFYIGDRMVGQGVPEVRNTSTGLLETRLELRLRLADKHFNAGTGRDRDGGEMVVLRCHAETLWVFLEVLMMVLFSPCSQ